MPNEITCKRYGAFISYHHSEIDNRIAREVHAKLERYHLDGEMHKRWGRKSIAPVFLDVAELPLTSSLGNDITQALRDASALVVICSTTTKESTWVDREIDEFLLTHDQSRVFMVMVDGEPRDIAPERLRYYVDQEGQRHDVEPLAADFRSGVKGRSRRNEVTRLVAGILGVPFDSLVKRAERRRNQLLSAAGALVAAASISFGLYNAYMNRRISEQYEQTLISQSAYLASESTKLLESGDRYGAIELALAALPSDENATRPVVDSAVLALQKASGAYVPLKSSEAFGVSHVFDSKGPIERMALSPNEDLLATATSGTSPTIRVFDCAHGEILYDSRTSEGEIRDIDIDDAGHIVLTFETLIRCVDSHSGSALWENEGHYEFEATDINEAQDMVRVATVHGMRWLDILTGSPRHASNESYYSGTPALMDAHGQRMAIANYTYDGFGLPPQALEGPLAQELAAGMVSADDDGAEYYVGYIDYGDTQATFLPGVFPRAFGISVLDDGCVVAVTGSGYDGESADSMISPYDSAEHLMRYTRRVICYEQDGSVRWQKDIKATQVPGDTIVAEYVLEDGVPQRIVVCCFANVLVALDSSTGRQIVRHELPSTICDVAVGDYDMFARIRSSNFYSMVDYMALCLLENGSLAQCSLVDDKSHTFDGSCIPCTGSTIVASDCIYVATNSLVYRYDSRFYDDSAVGLKMDGDAYYTGLSVHDHLVTPDALVFGALPNHYLVEQFGSDKADYDAAGALDCFVADNENPRWRHTFGWEEGVLEWLLLGTDTAGEQLVLICDKDDADGSDQRDTRMLIDISDGTFQEDELPFAAMGDGITYGALSGHPHLAGDAMVGLHRTEGGDYLLEAFGVYDLDVFGSVSLGQSLKGCSILSVAPHGVAALIATSASGDVSTATDTQYQLVDFTAGTIGTLDNGTWSKGAPVSWSEDGSRLWVVSEDELRSLDHKSLECVETVPLESMTVEDLYASAGRLYAVGYADDDLTLLLIDEHDASKTRIKLDDVGEQSLSIQGVRCIEEEDYLVVMIEIDDLAATSTGGTAYVVSNVSHEVCQRIRNCLGYADNANCFFVANGSGGDFAYTYYGLTELCERAETILGDYSMGEKRLSEYGLGNSTTELDNKQ